MSMPTLLLPAIKNKQFILAIETGRPVFYLSWANLSYEAERRYLQHVLQLREDEWSSGDRMWVLDWVAPFGHSRLLSQMLEHQLFATRWMRALYHRGNERGLKVKTFIGKAVLPEEAREWFASNPIAFSTPNQNATISTEIT